MSYTRRLNNHRLIYSSPVAKIPGTPSSLRVKRSSPLYPNRRPIFTRSPTVHPPLISSAEMNRRHQLNVNKEARQLKREKRDKIEDAIYRNRMYNIYRTPEHPNYHDTEVDYRDVNSIQKRQQEFEDKMNEASLNGPIMFGGRKKRTQKRKLRKTKRKKQNKRKSRKSRK